MEEKKCYVLRANYVAKRRTFCRDVVNTNIKMDSLNFIIFNNCGDKVGFILAEPTMNDATNMPMWNVGLLRKGV